MAERTSVKAHYALSGEQKDLIASVEAAINLHFGGEATLASQDLSPLDEFHIGGRDATRYLFTALELKAGQRVVDLGAGIGGGARCAASDFDCDVAGVDLTPEYCELANRLSARVGLGKRVRVEPADACETPFPDGTFDAAYTIHVAMNIEDNLALYREAHRILRPGGRLGIYDVMQGQAEEPLTFPVPWATDQSASHLVSPRTVEGLLLAAGFTIERVEDRTSYALEFFKKLQAASSGGPPPIGLHLLMGAEFSTKVQNMVQNITSARCGPWIAVAVRTE